ncbi:MAG TPA: FAD-binding protein, partial [Acidimicrobiales bacterium]
MAIDKVWVLAEAAEGAPTPVTLELLTEARTVAGTVEAVAWGPDVAKLAEPLGEYGATAVYDVGDLGGTLPGVPVAAAIAALVQGGNAPDAIFIGATYDGRDVAGRLSAKLDKPVLTNVTGLVAEGDGVGLSSQHPVFGGSHIVTARFTDGGPGILVIRAKSFSAEPAGGAAATVTAAPVPDVSATNTAKVLESHAEERSGPKLDEAPVVVSGGRGLGEAANYAWIEELAKLLHGAAGASRAIVDA